MKFGVHWFGGARFNCSSVEPQRTFVHIFFIKNDIQMKTSYSLQELATRLYLVTSKIPRSVAGTAMAVPWKDGQGLRSTLDVRLSPSPIIAAMCFFRVILNELSYKVSTTHKHVLVSTRNNEIRNLCLYIISYAIYPIICCNIWNNPMPNDKLKLEMPHQHFYVSLCSTQSEVFSGIFTTLAKEYCNATSYYDTVIHVAAKNYMFVWYHSYDRQLCRKSLSILLGIW